MCALRGQRLCAVIEVTIAAPPDEVWRALRDRDRIRHWHGWEFEGLEDEIELIFFKETKESDDRRTVWMGAGDRFDLIPDGAGTRVRITRAPLSGNAKWDAYYDQVTEGWTTFTHQLKFALEAHPGQPRRTLFYAGNGPEPEPGELVDGTPCSAPSTSAGCASLRGATGCSCWRTTRRRVRRWPC